MREVAGDRVRVCAGTAGDLRAIADAAAEPGAGLVILPGEVVTHREALAGLLKDPRVVTGTLLGGGWRARQFAFRVRSKRGRVISAASPYHAVHRPTSAFLGVLKVAAADRARARRLGRAAGRAGRRAAAGVERGARAQAGHVAQRALARRPARRGGGRRGRGRGRAGRRPRGRGPARASRSRRPRTSCSRPEDEARLREKLAAAPEDTRRAGARRARALGHPRRRQPAAAAVLGAPAVGRSRPPRPR